MDNLGWKWMKWMEKSEEFGSGVSEGSEGVVFKIMFRSFLCFPTLVLFKTQRN